MKYTKHEIDIRSLFNKIDYSKIFDIYKQSCFCTSIETDMETYILIDGGEDECLNCVTSLKDDIEVYLDSVK